MSDDIFKGLKDIFEIKQEKSIEFKEIYGLTVVCISKITIINDEITSAEIKAVGIIYKENDNYYFAPLDEVENLDEIIKAYVKKYMLK